MTIVIFNKNASGCDYSWCDEVVNVMRPNVLSNQHPITAARSRSQAITEFERDLAKAMKDPDSPQAREIRRLAGLHQQGLDIALVCCCDPLPCHADIIKASVLAYPVIEMAQVQPPRKMTR